MAYPRMARLLLVFGRSAALAGAALIFSTIIVEAVLFFRFGPDWNVGLMPLIALLRVVLAGFVVYAAFRFSPGPLFRILLGVGLGSFFLLYGWYLLLAGMGGELMAIGDFLYVLAALLVGGGILGGRPGGEPA